MTTPIVPSALTIDPNPEDADLWESFRMRGLSPEQATLQVYRRQRARKMGSEGNQADFAKLLPGRLETALVNFGHGASLGLAGDKNFLAASRVANPFTALASDIGGAAATGTVAAAAPIFAGAKAGTTAAVVGGATGAARGFFEPFPGLSRTESAALFGAGGVIGGVVLNRVLGKVGPWMSKVGGNIRQYFVKALGRPATDPQVAALTEAVLRQNLAKQGVNPEVLERMVQQWKATPVVEPPAPVARPGETIKPIIDTRTEAQYISAPKHGLEIEGTAGPLNKGPFPPTAAEMQGVNMGPRPTPTVQPPAPRAPGAGVDPNQQLGAFVDFLKASQNPSDAIQRLGTLRQLGVRGLPQEADLLTALGFPPTR